MTAFAAWTQANGITITESELEQFLQLKNNLLDWNKRINLTAITQDEDIWQKHFADSLTLWPWLPTDRFSMIDIGTGAGFPGFPIKIMRPNTDMTLVDSLRKRVYFLRDTVELLGLTDIECLHARAEDLIKQGQHRNQYDICTARAVARLDKLVNWCLPFIKPGGLFLAMKGPDVMEELESAKPAIKKLKGKVADVQKVEIVPGLVHSVVAISLC